MTKLLDITQLTGGTPLVALQRLGHGLHATLLAKLECFNPCASIKDRIGVSMVLAAEAAGTLRRGGTIIEPTSGNTGIALAFVAASRGYQCILTMPDNMGYERQRVLMALGATLELTPARLGMQGSVDRALELESKQPGAVLLQQFDNPANPRAHFKTTGPELWEQCGGDVDIFLAGVGTGGTFTGVTRFLKGRNPNLIAIAIEPARSALLSGHRPSRHGILGIGAGFVPANLDMGLVDEVIGIDDEEAYAAGRALAKQEGIFAGVSSGAAIAATIAVAKRPESKGKRLVTIFPDGGFQSLSSPMFGPP